jgi:selenide, water dikinase
MAAAAAASWRPSVLQQLLSDNPTVTRYKQLLVGVETGDDAGVWELDNGDCVMATTDFFMPMVDDPRDFGIRRSM